MAGSGGGTTDFAVVGGGLVGAALAYGLAGAGHKVAIFDETDTAIRASRGNFALVWVQSKGLGLPAYSGWTVRSSESWAGFADDLRNETGIDVHFSRPGGFLLCLSEAELEAKKSQVLRFHNQPGVASYKIEFLPREEIAKMLPGLGPDVVGGSYCPLDGHVNSLKLFRALFEANSRRGVAYLPGRKVEAIARDGAGFRLKTSGDGVWRAAKVVLAAGNANQGLAPMVGLKAPMKPERGQILVTERIEPFLKHPLGTLRQTDEGTVMIGDSREEGRDPAGMTLDVNAVMAARAIRMFPRLAKLNVVRTWRAIRVMPADGFPIYDQSEEAPGAFVATCHSGVTLAAAHAKILAPMIAKGALPAAEVGAFSARRFDVQAGG